MPTTRLTLLQTVIGMLEGILIASGYETNLGATLDVGEIPELGPDDPDDRLVLTINPDRVTYQGEDKFVRLPLTIAVLRKADLADPLATIETGLGDVKKAMEVADRTLGGLVARQFEVGSTRAIPRAPGSVTVGAAIDYEFPYREAWGRP